ncbi:MAG TPA: Rieske 2Fe-2S domain-containing protein [Candidatus Lustribacter sp.]
MAIGERPAIREHPEVRSGRDTLGGRYLRSFWQPVFHRADLVPGQATPLRIMGQDFTLYRGDGGTPILVDARCPHRGAQLSAGWVDGDTLRCFYHGWRFGADGTCLEQPAEGSAFRDKVALRSYPTRDYLGLIFAYLGRPATPEFPRYPEFERSAGFIEVDSYFRACNAFQNLENALDMSHVEFVHHDNTASFAGIGSGLQLEAAESTWGVTYRYTRPDGAVRVQQFGMPNVFYMTALPTDPEIGWQESLFWWVPIDDTKHVQFSLHRVPAAGDAAAAIRSRRERRRATIDLAHQDLCDRILSGELRLRDVDAARVDLVRLQDDIAQISQGRIADRDHERLGRGDVGVIAIRRLWHRELSALERDAPQTVWRRTPDIVPSAWMLGDTATLAGRHAASAPDIVDVRPFVEVEVQLRALRRTGAMAERD